MNNKDDLDVSALLNKVYENGLELPKCETESYEDGFLDGLNYFIQEMKVKIGALDDPMGEKK